MLHAFSIVTKAIHSYSIFLISAPNLLPTGYYYDSRSELADDSGNSSSLLVADDEQASK